MFDKAIWVLKFAMWIVNGAALLREGLELFLDE